ncbi:carbon-nitrogen hydrolase family protein [Nonomuraea guangzhouensis]|uniref:Carbon-nitrogen hydrolase family protein n=1 Tax=Nonomuraea guangzhouensis TaxID=1291555 RepID=A0ABW4GBS6_9ACTN|nr:carbon-nitrogen hydrolase family protein [Nonomuraea guangzhouensis]
MTTRRVAVVQAAPRLFDLPETLRRFRDLLARAAAEGTHLVVFPEAFIGGYPKGSTFGASVGRRDDQGRALFARYRRSAVEIPGEAFEEISAAVAAHGVHVVVGVIERAGRTLYCSALLFAPDGTLLARHRKLVPTGTERVIWGRGAARDVIVTDTDIGRIGLAICWESYMPLYRTALYQRDVQIYCAPTVDDRDVWTSTMRHIAVEGRCFVLSANQFAGRNDYPHDFAATDSADAIIQGGSCVVDPFGRLLAGPSFGKQDMLVADIDLAVLDGAYLDLDVVGHYARPDIFQFRTSPPES